MKLALALAVLIAGTATASAQFLNEPRGQSSFGGGGLYGTGSNPNSHYVQPYTTQSGQFHAGHYQTNPNNTQMDNYGTRGNYNPYSGTYGTRSPHY